MLVLTFPAYYGFFVQVGYAFSWVASAGLIRFQKVIAAMSPTAEILFSFLFSFIITLYTSNLSYHFIMYQYMVFFWHI